MTSFGRDTLYDKWSSPLSSTRGSHLTVHTYPHCNSSQLPITYSVHNGRSFTYSFLSLSLSLSEIVNLISLYMLIRIIIHRVTSFTWNDATDPIPSTFTTLHPTVYNKRSSPLIPFSLTLWDLIFLYMFIQIVICPNYRSITSFTWNGFSDPIPSTRAASHFIQYIFNDHPSFSLWYREPLCTYLFTL